MNDLAEQVCFIYYLLLSCNKISKIVLTCRFILAMHSVHRTFHVPVSLDPSKPKISIILHEPSLTEDCLGHKTWAASYLLAKRLPHLLPFLSWFADPKYQSVQSRHVDLFKLHLANAIEYDCVVPRILELGAGTGLVGLAAAATFATVVHLTDLPEICENLALNCQRNQSIINDCGGSTVAFPLDWSGLPLDDVLPTVEKYDMILAADSLYSPEHPEMLANTIKYFLKRETSSRVVVELPLREAYQAEVDGFVREMDNNALELLTQGEETGFDDWEDGAKEVRCWWGLWVWKTQPNSD